MWHHWIRPRVKWLFPLLQGLSGRYQHLLLKLPDSMRLSRLAPVCTAVAGKPAPESRNLSSTSKAGSFATTSSVQSASCKPALMHRLVLSCRKLVVVLLQGTGDLLVAGAGRQNPQHLENCTKAQNLLVGPVAGALLLPVPAASEPVQKCAEALMQAV